MDHVIGNMDFECYNMLVYDDDNNNSLILYIYYINT